MKPLIWVTLLALLHQTVSPVPVTPTSPKDGVITVSVVDSVSRKPISGARITFIFFQNPPPNIVTYINSDVNGQNVFKDLADGRYGISAEHDGYVANPTA